MAHRFSKEDLDEQFEQFLKESLSDESFGNEPKTKSSILESSGQARKKEPKKQPVPWWISEDDSDDSNPKFIKQRKKIIGGKDELVEDGEKKMPLSNDQSGMYGSSGSFLKSRRLSRSIVEVDEDHVEGIQLQRTAGVSVSLSRDSLEDSVVASGHNEQFGGVGLDTLEEQEEKERFFANLENGASSTIDYSRLNKELDSNDSEALQAFLSRNHPEMKVMEEEGCEDEPKNNEKSGDYSEDFEEASETNNKVEQAFSSEVNEEKAGMLDKVVLDSQDSTIETQKVSEQQEAAVTEQNLPLEIPANEMNGTGISSGQTNSDIEALHQAYCHVEHSLGDTDEQRINARKMEATEDSSKDASQNKEGCPKNASTTESDLPTIEELMKPIKADSSFARGCDLEPRSSVKVTHSNTDDLAICLPLKEHQSDTILQNQNIGCLMGQHHEQDNVSVQALTTQDNEDCHNQGASKSYQGDKIKDYVLQKSSVLHQDNKANQVHQHSTWTKEDLNSVINKQVIHKNIKNTAATHKKKSLSGPYTSVRSSGYGKSSSPLKHLSTVNEKKGSKEGVKKPVSKARSPPRQKEIFSGTKLIQTAADPVSTRKNYLDTPGDPSTSSLQQQAKARDSCLQTHNVSSYSPPSSGRELYLLQRVQEAEEKWAAAHGLTQQLKATSLQKEKEMETKILEMKMQQDKELFQLNQENYVLRTQLNKSEELNKGTKWAHMCEKIPKDGEMLKEIQKEVQNQEVLLQGYQQENERLYKQVKELQMNNNKNEESMFKENQRLMTELASLKEQMDKNNLLSRGVQNSEPAGNKSFTDLLLELRAAKAIEANLLEDRKRLKQDKQALEVDLGQMKKERDLARAQMVSISEEKIYEMKIMEESYKEEIGRLQKRLQWFAENQELLDKDAARLRGAKEEIDKLKREVDKLRNEAGNQSAQQKKRLKDRAADAKRIQDLERQACHTPVSTMTTVKEMEGILKRRHPNSLPALIYAAATATSEGDGDASAKTNTVDFLEKRVKKLELELEGKDDEAKKSLRAMEQQFQKIKLQYEKRVGELEQLLAYKLLSEPQKLQDQTANLAALRQELCSINETHQVTVKSLEAEKDSLRNRIAQLERQKTVAGDPDLQSLEYQVEQAHAKAKLVRLNQELAAKDREIQDLTKTIERLQKERRMMLSDKESAGKTDTKEKLSGASQKGAFNAIQRNTRNEEFFPGTLDDKIYQPNAFADSHISEVLQENARLKEELEKLTLELSQQRVKSQAALANSENIIRRTKENSEEYISALKASHQKDLEKILCQHAVEHSTSKVAELNSKISTQEILIKHLQQQVSALQKDQEALTVSQMREEILQKEMAKLLEELKEAKENQSPEMKNFVCLDRKIKHLEARYEQREQELQQVIQQTQQIAEVEQFQETEKWRKLALLKNQELQKFRVELDSMLDVLRQLQKQGVIIPVGGLNMPESYWKI
ncbi:hypothetical protein lerEdw1_001250 [Lerista edwardsae]|nr:hypothetical protein lerEdw1_001250 [Lerista edwardsae]